MSNEQEARSSSKRGLLLILIATAIAGAAGYLLQILVPLWLREPADYLQFTVFWATTFLIISAMSGLQQEVTRATRVQSSLNRSLGSTSRESARVLLRVGLAVIAITLAIVSILMIVVGDQLFSDAWPRLLGALAMAIVSYVAVAVLSGIFYGIERFEFAAATTTLDAILRFITVLVPLLWGLGVIPTAYGVVLPFALTALIMWWISRGGVRGQYRLDSGAGKLLRGSLIAILAALATGVLISGLPTVLNLTSAALGEQSLAAIILALTITRAPLVVPLLALQSFLVVGYRKHEAQALRRALLLFVATLLVTTALAGLAALFGPALLSSVYGNHFALDALQLALIVISGGATAGLCIVAPALLARGFHGRYLTCWVLAAVGTVVALLLTHASGTATITAIALGPVLACIAGFIMLAVAPAEQTPVQSGEV